MERSGFTPQREGDGQTPKLELTLDVLGVREDNAWCAIALDMSLRGYGDTFDAALKALLDAVEAQVSFAVEHDNLNQIFIPAEPHYFRLHADMRREAIKRKLLGRVQTGLPDYWVGDVPLPLPNAAAAAHATA